MGDNPAARPRATNGVATGQLGHHPASMSAANGGPASLQVPPAYRRKPAPPPPRRRRSCCCCFFLTLVIFIVSIIVIAAIAFGIFYLVFLPQRPTYAVTSARFAAFNVSTADDLLVSSQIDVTITAGNPNKKIAFIYSTISVSAYAAAVMIGNGSLPGFVHDAQNTTVLKLSLVTTGPKTIDPVAAASLTTSKSIDMDIEADTRAGIKIGKLTTKQIEISVSCTGFSLTPPKSKVAEASAPAPAPTDSTAASTPPPPATKLVNANCKPRIKIWIWNF